MQEQNDLYNKHQTCTIDLENCVNAHYWTTEFLFQFPWIVQWPNQTPQEAILCSLKRPLDIYKVFRCGHSASNCLLSNKHIERVKYCAAKGDFLAQSWLLTCREYRNETKDMPKQTFYDELAILEFTAKFMELPDHVLEAYAAFTLRCGNDPIPFLQKCKNPFLNTIMCARRSKIPDAYIQALECIVKSQPNTELMLWAKLTLAEIEKDTIQRFIKIMEICKTEQPTTLPHAFIAAAKTLMKVDKHQRTKLEQIHGTWVSLIYYAAMKLNHIPALISFSRHCETTGNFKHEHDAILRLIALNEPMAYLRMAKCLDRMKEHVRAKDFWNKVDPALLPEK